MSDEIVMRSFDPVGLSAFRKITNALTNRERNAWARAGYPGLKKKDAAPIAAMFPAVVRRLNCFTVV